MATRYAIEEALGFCIEYIQKVKSKKGECGMIKKSLQCMMNILEGCGHLHRLGVDLKGWAHSFTLHNATTT